MAQAAASWWVYAVLRLLMLGAWRQVYEIKAQSPINNLAAYYKTYTKYNSYCLQQSDVYTHFKCTSVSSIYSIWCGVQNQIRRKERTLSPSTPSEALLGRLVSRKKPILYPNYQGFYSGLPYPPPTLSLHSISTFFLCILKEPKTSHYSFRSWFSSRGAFYRTKLALGAVSRSVTSVLVMYLCLR